MSELNEKYEVATIPDKEVTQEDKAWLLMIALGTLSGRVLQELTKLTYWQSEQAKVNKGNKSPVLKLANAIDRAGKEFVNRLRDFKQFYLIGQQHRHNEADRLAELVLEAVMMPLEEGPERMTELHAYLQNFRAGQYRHVNQKLFDAFEEVSDDHDEAVEQIITKFGNRISKANRQMLTSAIQVLIAKRVNEKLDE